MNTEKKSSQQGLQLDSRRWHWWAGAAAATLANVTAAQAADVTVPLSDNYLSVTGGDHLSSDLTDDGTSDVSITSVTVPTPNRSLQNLHAIIGGERISAVWNGGLESAKVGSVFTEHLGTGATPPLTENIRITFHDPQINGGVATPAELAVTVTDGKDDVEVQLDSYTYDQISASAPDQFSTLALLALGAGGVLAFRQRRQAA